MSKIIISLGALFMVIFGSISVGFAISVYSVLSWAYVGAKFYSWFVHPIFTTLPNIGVFPMAGLYMFARVFNLNYITTNSKDNKTQIIVSMIAPWVWLLTGWFFTII